TSSAREIGYSAGQRLLQRISGGNLQLQSVILPPVLIRRGSA
ncbi:TPA: Mal regulon transcriptional regulator MalI, partial [Yersinia enterocolitica]|nr:Mal regulon transcriptional regulator MalI [Yersinia enterocolitica]HDM8419700.1 Mal regulon transcriptional regulator MalI [Yersinia enterocolitica]HDM8449033.1 Mal regulon transcriptional regulator MalI [Yersinia enterocolitica]